MTRTVLCVDREERLPAVTAAVEAEEDISTVEASSPERARELLLDEPVVCVVTAYDLESGSGMDVVDALREEAPQTPCVLFTDVSPAEIDTASFEELIVEYLNRDYPDADERLGFIVDDVINHSAQVGFLKPDDEEQRMDALERYEVEDLPIEESFDRLTDVIADHFDVDVSFIGLVERDEENFLACTGADWDTLTREDTICTHSMLQDDVMVVEDVREDRRFSENEVLANLGIVSYAGANMTTPDGHVIGQVCVLDSEPREYDEAEREHLQKMAETVMEVLELRQNLREAQQAQEVEA